MRLEPHLDIARHFRCGFAEAEDHRPRRAHDNSRGSGLQFGHITRADGPHDVQAIGRLLPEADLRRLRRLCKGKHRVRAATLFQGDLHAGELSARRLDHDVERRDLADESLRLPDGNARAFGPPCPEPGPSEPRETHERRDDNEFAHV